MHYPYLYKRKGRGRSMVKFMAENENTSSQSDTAHTQQEGNQATVSLGIGQALILTFLAGIVIGGLFTAMTGLSFTTAGTGQVVAEGPANDNDNNPNPSEDTQDNPQPSNDNTGNNANDNQQPSGNSGSNVQAANLVDDDPVKGQKDAPLTIVEFSDFECPFCGRFYSNTLSQIEENYVDTGKVKLVFRDFPLESLHPSANIAAQAAECAQEQGKFWEYHDTIFENQNQLSESSLKQWASDIGLDTEQFNQCLDSGKFSDEVQQDKQAAQDAGGRGTPFFVIGSQTLSGAQPYQNFQQVIESELNS